MQGQGPFGYPPNSSQQPHATPHFAGAPPVYHAAPPSPYPPGPAYHASYAPGAPPSYPPNAAAAPNGYPSSARYAAPSPSHAYAPYPAAYGAQAPGYHPPSSQRTPIAEAPQGAANWGGQAALPQVVFSDTLVPAGLDGVSSVFAFGLGLVGVAFALGFDVLFLRFSVPRIGPYAWYLTTALSFLIAGYGATKLTRAGRGLSTVAMLFAALIYGCGDIGLGVVLESLSRASALRLAAEGVAIAFAMGIAGVMRGARARAR